MSSHATDLGLCENLLLLLLLLKDRQLTVYRTAADELNLAELRDALWPNSITPNKYPTRFLRRKNRRPCRSATFFAYYLVRDKVAGPRSE